MLNFKNLIIPSCLIIASIFVVMTFVSVIYAATSPGLGLASTFSILSSTYTNTTGGTTINGDLGYTIPPATAPTVNGTTHSADATYNQAGIDQATALAALDSQPCTFTFAPGAIDLASDTTHGSIGIYAPGVYCIIGAASVGGGGTITLNGTGTFIFRMTGALNTSAGSIVTTSNGGSACDIWWTPGAATTIGANSTFIGNVIDAAGITIGNLVTWTGRALAFGGTVSTDSDTLTVPTCISATATPTQTPTPTPISTTSNSNSTGNSNSSSSNFIAGAAPICPNLPPVSAPNNMSVTRARTSATITFDPVGGADSYVIAYGFTPGDQRFSALNIPAGNNNSPIVFTINDLAPGTTYYFQVRAQVGCAPGPWSSPNSSPHLPNTGIGSGE